MILKNVPVSKNMAGYKRIEDLAKEAFPPAEYLAPAEMVEMAKRSDFDFWALYDEKRFVGFTAIERYQNMAYLFFLAIDSACRDCGYGTRAIETIQALYPGAQQVVDMEMLDDKAENHVQRVKRREFYMRNGYKPTGHFLSCFGVDYEIFCMDNNFNIDLFQEMMATNAPKGFKPKYFERKI